MQGFGSGGREGEDGRGGRGGGEGGGAGADTDKLQLSHAGSESSSLKAQIKAALHPNKEKKIEDVGNLKKKKKSQLSVALI